MPEAMKQQGNDGPVRVNSELTDAQRAINRMVNENVAKMETQVLAAEMRPKGQPADVIARRNTAFQGFMQGKVDSLIPYPYKNPVDPAPGQDRVRLDAGNGQWVEVPTSAEFAAMKNELGSAQATLSQTLGEWAPQFTDRDKGVAFWSDPYGEAQALFERKLRDALIVIRGGTVDDNQNVGFGDKSVTPPVLAELAMGGVAGTFQITADISAPYIAVESTVAPAGNGVSVIFLGA